MTRHTVPVNAASSDVKLVPATKDDARALAELLIKVNKDDMFVRVGWPDARDAVEQITRVMEDIIDDKKGHTVKAVDVRTKATCGVAVWVKWDGSQDFEPPSLLLALRGARLQKEDELGNKFAAELKYYRGLWVKGKAAWYLASIAVDQDFQRRGIGSKMLRWGTDKADADGMVSWLEATPAGYNLYRKTDWRAVGAMRFDLSDYAGKDIGYGEYVLRPMLRLPEPRK